MATSKSTGLGDRTYFTMIPNILDDSDLSVHAFRLYVHMKRRAGEDGSCFESTENLAKCCKMSAGAVSNAKQELIDAGFIVIKKMMNKDSGRLYDQTFIVNVWQENMARYVMGSPHEPIGSPHEPIGSPHELKNNQLIITNKEEEEEKPAAASAASTRSPYSGAMMQTGEARLAEIFCKVTGFFGFPASTMDQSLAALRGIAAGKTDEQAVEYLMPFFKAWTAANYSRSNTSWLTDWAVTGRVPQTKRMATLTGIDEKEAAKEKRRQEVERLRAEYKAMVAAEAQGVGA